MFGRTTSQARAPMRRPARSTSRGAEFRVQMRRELAALRRRLGTTTIYVTHDQVEAMSLGDRIVVMHEGSVQQIGTPLDIYDRPANLFVAGFLGTPPMNQIRGRLVQGDGPTFEAEAVGFTLRLPEGAAPPAGTDRVVVLGVRPEAIRPHAGIPGFDAVVEFVEPLGYESVVTVRAAGISVTLRVEANATPSIGDPMACAIDLGGLHWFDAATGLRL